MVNAMCWSEDSYNWYPPTELTSWEAMLALPWVMDWWHVTSFMTKQNQQSPGNLRNATACLISNSQSLSSLNWFLASLVKGRLTWLVILFINQNVSNSTFFFFQFAKAKLTKAAFKDQRITIGTSLVVQWLRLCTSNAGDPGLNPGQGTRSHTSQLRPSADK